MSLGNSCRFTGRLGQDPDLQYTPAGMAIVKVGIAVKDRRKKGDEWVEETTWVNLTAFGTKAETLHQVCNQGDLIQVDTQYQTSTYEADGETKYRHDFIVREWSLAARKGGPQSASEEVEPQENDEEDDLPF